MDHDPYSPPRTAVGDDDCRLEFDFIACCVVTASPVLLPLALLVLL